MDNARVRLNDVEKKLTKRNVKAEILSFHGARILLDETCNKLELTLQIYAQLNRLQCSRLAKVSLSTELNVSRGNRSCSLCFVK